MKKIIAFLLLGLTNIALNFTVFIVSYNKLATPFLHEAQRTDNADYIITVTLSGFVMISFLTLGLLYLLYTKK